MARLLLVDIPKQQATLDVVSYPVQGGFRGFQVVLTGWHFVEVRSDATRLCGEVVIARDGETAILTPDGHRLVRIEDPQREELASSGAMDGALINVLSPSAAIPLAWFQATNLVRLPRDSAPLPLTGPASRARNFLAAFTDDNAALARAQGAFAALVTEEPGAFDQLKSLWNTFANSGSAVAERPSFFARLAGSIAATLTVAPTLRELAQAVSLGQLAEDLADDGGPEGAEAAAKLRAALA